MDKLVCRVLILYHTHITKKKKEIVVVICSFGLAEFEWQDKGQVHASTSYHRPDTMVTTCIT